MTSSDIASSSFASNGVSISNMDARRLLIEEYISSYFDLLNYRFDDEINANSLFSDGKYWGHNKVVVSENVQGYVPQGDLIWDDVDENGMIDMFHQTQDTGYIADIYDASHSYWDGCGYAWGHATSDSIEALYYIPFERFFNEVNSTFDIVDLYFGSPGMILEGIDITEDFSEVNLPTEFFEEKTPIIVSGWTERGI